ncbi:MAG: hypothetical protein OXG24_01615 [Gammaproteobacteria bacterium]|nr:hypothetical protein [Gammaproteobacteria bacterium]
MSKEIEFEVKVVPAGTGSLAWDNPFADKLVHRFMPHDRRHGPMIGILEFAGLRPTASVLQSAVVAVGEDAKAGRYGEFTLFVSSKDEDTRNTISDIAASRNVAVFVTSATHKLMDAIPVGAITLKDSETLNQVSEFGGTVSANEFADCLDIEKTAAGNRLTSLHRKGYLQRIARPHPMGDLFVDPRSIELAIEETDESQMD